MEQTDLLRLATQTLDQLGIPYALVGSFASGVWGESRFTQDIDILVDLKPAQVEPLCRAFRGPEFYVSEAAAREATEHSRQFNIIHPASGNKIDFMLAGEMPWAVAQLRRRKRVPLFPGHDVSVAAPEDVILGKLVYYSEGGSEKHLRDITGIVKISGDMIDRTYLAEFASLLGVSDIWQALLQRTDSAN
ncbi:MAG: hypothetical protein L0Z07_10455 [Planctomycetes bacterium]|nr:hypothetical protein [Planctomycetota bacterium]